MEQSPGPIPDICPPEQWPSNIVVGERTVITGDRPFRRFYSTRDSALTIGSDCTMIGTQFSLGPQGVATIGVFCYFTNVVLLCEESVHIGDRVVIGWNATIADADFHPLSPVQRIQDAVAVSPLGEGWDRPAFASKPVIIDDDVWIGPGATILKGVHVHHGAWIEPGAVVVNDVPPEARALGNPARVQ
ncbi:MAG TPA: acyltransferase [Thermomicrobiales bacterium]|nr:acyltransferase [Thermomicrobiales bacterium]